MAGWRRAMGVTAKKRDPFGRLFLLTAPLILGLLVLAATLGPETVGRRRERSASDRQETPRR